MVAVVSPGFAIRGMERSDIVAVHGIEKSSYPYPWSRGIFVDCLRVGYRCYVLTENEVICGYAIVSAAMDEAHLLNLCIHPDWRRMGLADMVLAHVIDEARIGGAQRMFLEVRPSNRGAIKLYRQAGFHVIGRRPDYYPAEAGREDAVVMVHHIDG